MEELHKLSGTKWEGNKFCKLTVFSETEINDEYINSLKLQDYSIYKYIDYTSEIESKIDIKVDELTQFYAQTNQCDNEKLRFTFYDKEYIEKKFYFDDYDYFHDLLKKIHETFHWARFKNYLKSGKKHFIYQDTSYYKEEMIIL